MSDDRKLGHPEHHTAPWRPFDDYVDVSRKAGEWGSDWRAPFIGYNEEHIKVLDDDPALVAQKFNDLYFMNGAWKSVSWAGVHTAKYPTDLWMYQQLMFDQRPELIIECGVQAGGATLYLHCIAKLFQMGRVIGIDVDLGQVDQNVHNAVSEPDGIRLLEGSSTDPEIFEHVRQEAEGKKVMVILDSDHRYEHVIEELRLYSTLVQPGGHMIVEDTDLDYPAPRCRPGTSIYPNGGPGKAVDEFLAEHDEFERNRGFDIHMLSMCTGGCLVRTR